jgi:hypothetical protein
LVAGNAVVNKVDASVDFRPQNEVNPVFNNSPVFQIVAPTTKTTATPQIDDRPKPNLTICGALKAKLEDQAQMFKSTGSGQMGMVIRVENSEARQPDERATKARNIAAVLRFSSGNGVSATVSRAYGWSIGRIRFKLILENRKRSWWEPT